MNSKSNWFHSLQFCLIHNFSSCHEIFRYILSLILEVIMFVDEPSQYQWIHWKAIDSSSCECRKTMCPINGNI